MRRMALPFVLVAVVLFGVSYASGAPSAQEKTKVNKPKPADRVVVIYFHRTKRCPTCLKMGSYSEQAVAKRFASQLKAGTVEFYYVDFQNPKNAALAKGYKIKGPSLIVAKIEKNKAVAVKNLKEIWTKNSDKRAFFKYVQDSVINCQKPTAKTASKSDSNPTATKPR